MNAASEGQHQQSEDYYVRNPNFVIMVSSRSLTAIRQDQTVMQLAIDTPLESLLLNQLTSPATIPQIAQSINAASDLVETALRRLAGVGAIIKGKQAALSRLFALVPEAQGRACRRLVWGISGTVQASGLIALLPNFRRLVAEEIDVIVTKAARQFIRPQVLEYLGARVWQSPYTKNSGFPVPHMHLAEKADVILILPASARTIHRLAHGCCSDLLSLVVTASRAPLLVAPSMNPKMIQHPAVARNLEQIRKDGAFVVSTGIGYAASGDLRSPSFISAGLRDAESVATAVAQTIAIHKKAQQIPAPHS